MLNTGDTTSAGREDLRIRPLVEHPALRRALGLDQPAVAAAPADGSLPRRHAGTHRTPGLGRPVAPSSNVLGATASVVTRRTATPARRFDRRALLESAG